MRKKEQEFTTKLQKWLKHNWPHSGPIEVKVSYDPKFNYKSGFKPHQLDNLINAMDSRYCLTYKISDMDRMSKPYDLVCYHHAIAVVAIWWVSPGNKVFYLIDPHLIRDEIEAGQASLSEGRSEELAMVIGTLI